MELRDFKHIDKPNSTLKATFMVYIPEWDFNLAVTYFEKNDGSNWFGYPQQEWTNKEGIKKYKWLAFFGEKGKPRFEKTLKEKVRELMPKGSSYPQEQMNYNNDDLPF
jgi:hypothetical protein